MSQCSSCKEDLSFKDVLYSSNPYSLKCGGCPDKIKPNPVIVTLLIILISIATLIILGFMPFIEIPNLELSGFDQIVALCVLGLVFEAVFYVGLKSGAIGTN